MSDDETEFYNNIINVTEYAGGDILKKDAETIYQLILKDYRKNISLAAIQGLKHSYICIYEVGAKYDNSIPVDDFVRINNLQTKFQKFNVEPAIDRIVKKLHPFRIQIEILDKSILSDLDKSNIISGDNQEKIIIGIIVRWD